VLPALGTHRPMSGAERARVFPGVPPDAFIAHNWREDTGELGRIEADWVERVSGGAARFDWPVRVNKLLAGGGFSLIVSIGQVAPHEVTGMSGHTKNILVGCGGWETIGKSHFLGALWGMERILGRVDTPVRALFDESFRRFGDRLPPVLWALTVVGSRSAGAGGDGEPPPVRGFFAGFGRECFERAAALSRRVNVFLLDEPVRKAVAYLAPEEYRSVWLGNKAIYRTRLAMAAGGELLILAPGLDRFGEDGENDRLIRRHGFRPAQEILERMREDKSLAANLCAAAHLIHGSPDGAFTVRLCAGPGLSRRDIEAAGFLSGSLDEALARYPPGALAPGWNTLPGGERIFFLTSPSLGLWAERTRWGE